MALELGKDRPEWPASREADPRNLEQQAGLSGDNDADRIQTQPDDEAKKETDENFIKSQSANGGEKDDLRNEK
jgi:hypothetical protein